MKLSTRDRTAFQKIVYAYYDHNRREFPWRIPALKEHDGIVEPYKVLVSEIMLQQTQTDRVVEKYISFLKRFPTVKKLATASLKDVLTEWQGLGYNRRSKSLKAIAETVVRDFHGRVPATREALISLPGIGPYTADAILAFAFDKAVVCIETNIRTVFIHHFFHSKTNINDEVLIPLIEQTLDRKQPREWYSALMDYGAYIKSQYPNPSRKSAHHVRQKPFKGSDRQLRGAALKLLLKGSYNLHDLAESCRVDDQRMFKIMSQFQKERMVVLRKKKYKIV